MEISAIDTLEAIVDGDTIVPGMSFVLPDGIGKTQYFNPSTGECTPDYTKSGQQLMLYPTNYSSNSGKFLVPKSGSEQWYFGNPESGDAAILNKAGGTVKTEWNKVFEKTTYKINNQTFPALKIIGNLASADQLNDVILYFKGTFNGVTITCHGEIGVKESVGNNYDILLNCVNEEGLNDTVIDNDTEWLRITARLQDSGVDVSATGSWSWQRATSTGMAAVSHVPGVTEITDGGKTLKLYDAAVEGTEEYFAVVTHNGKTYRKGIAVSDTHDPYYINIGRSSMSNLVSSKDTISYTPAVVQRGSGAVQSGWTFSFAAIDNEGSTVKSSTGNTFSVTGEEVHSHGGLNIHLSARKS